MRVNPVSTVAFEECYCLIWESGIIGQPCEWGPVEQWGRDPSPNLINTLWAENKSVIWPAFNAHWLTVYSALLPVKYLFMSGEGNRVSGRKIQRKANSEKRWNSETSSPAQLCVKEERDAVFLWGVLGLSDDLLTPHPPRIPSYTCSPLWHTLLIQIMTSISQLFPLERYTSAALCYKTKSHPCMLLTCSTTHRISLLTKAASCGWKCNCRNRTAKCRNHVHTCSTAWISWYKLYGNDV